MNIRILARQHVVGVRENRENMIQEGMEFGRLFYEKKLSNGKDETHVKKEETMKAECV